MRELCDDARAALAPLGNNAATLEAIAKWMGSRA
jgi:hypothetical protein